MTETNKMEHQEDLQTGIARRSQRLADIATELKSELFGIDAEIDRVIDSLRAWYVMPGIIHRPVIVCLWGLTGTGKTQLTRSLAQKLGFYDRFVEVQMDGFSNGAQSDEGTISGMLETSGIQEGAPGMLVLDEFQRYRTRGPKGEDLRVARYQDVWALLSDGRLAPSLAFLSKLEFMLADAQYDDEREDPEDKKPRYKLRLTAYEARRIRRLLKLQSSLLEIMRWTPEQLQAALQAFREQSSAWETDYSKLLIFVCGNLDEMYEQTANAVQDCDTDADIFHAMTKRLSVIDVKTALGRRFRPEQIARLGNNHVIYPSLSRAAYERLIVTHSERYARDLTQTCGLEFVLERSLLTQIYDNAVFPAQGTRPLLSSIHAILSAPLVNAALWAIERGAVAGDQIHIGVDAGEDGAQRGLQVRWGSQRVVYPVTFELDRLKQRTNSDFRALLAVHEAGHALLYAMLFRQPPQEMKINAASFDGGYNSYMPLRAQSRQSSLDRICVSLGGRAAEALVFGEQACTTGAEQDYKQATQGAAQFVRYHGFGQRLSRTDVTQNSEDGLNTDVAASNAAMEELLVEQHQRASQLLRDNTPVFLRIAKALMQDGELRKETLAQWLDLQVAQEPTVLEPYAAHLQAFESEARWLGDWGKAQPMAVPQEYLGTELLA